MKLFKRFLSFGSEDDYDSGIELYNQHLYPEAIECFKNILTKKSPATSLQHQLAQFYCSQAHRNLGVVLFTSGNILKALSEFRKALALNSKHLDLYYFIGICLNNVGKYHDALKTFEYVLEVDPENLPVKLKLAITLHNLKMWENAVEIYRNILLKNPEYADVHFRLGLALLGQGQPEQAMEEFGRAVEINPDYLDARIKLGITQIYLEKFDLADLNFSDLLEKYPEYSDLHYYKGLVLIGKQALDQALNYFKQALAVNPKYKEAKVKLAMIYCRKNNFINAFKELEEALLLDPNDQNLKTMTRIMRNIINQPSFLSPSSLSPSSLSNAQAKSRLTQLFNSQKPLTETLQEFGSQVDITLQFSEMISLIKLKNFSQEDIALWKMMIPYIQDYMKKHPDYPDLHNTLGILFLNLDKIEKAETSFEKAVELNPNYTQASINLLKILYQRRKYQPALDQGDKLIAKGIAYPDLYCAVGDINLALGRYEKALELAGKALSVKPGYAHAFFIQAAAYENLGDLKKAGESYRQCLNNSSGQALSKKADEALARFSGQ